MVRFVLVVILAFSLSGCLVPSDMVINIEGSIIDEEGEVYDSCQFDIVAENRSIYSFSSSGNFHKSFVLGGFNYNKANLVIKCDGSRTKSLSLPAPPQSISEYMDFGAVLVEREL